MKRVEASNYNEFGLEKQIKIYFDLLNQNFSDDFNSYKNPKILNTYHIEKQHKLTFNWVIAKVEVERIGNKTERWLIIREYGCRGSYGFVVLGTYDGNDLTIMSIDLNQGGYEVRTNDLLGYEMTNLKLCQDYVLLLSSIKDNKINAY